MRPAGGSRAADARAHARPGRAPCSGSAMPMLLEKFANLEDTFSSDELMNIASLGHEWVFVVIVLISECVQPKPGINESSF